METVLMVAALLAAVAVLALALRAYSFVKRLHQVVDALGRTVEQELNPAVRAWREAAEGVRTAANTLDSGCASIASALDRVDRLTEKLEPLGGQADWLMRTMIGPAIAKVASWVSGFRKGIASVHGGKAEEGLDE